jgi:hypothetical protein
MRATRSVVKVVCIAAVETRHTIGFVCRLPIVFASKLCGNEVYVEDVCCCCCCCCCFGVLCVVRRDYAQCRVAPTCPCDALRRSTSTTTTKKNQSFTNTLITSTTTTPPLLTIKSVGGPLLDAGAKNDVTFFKTRLAKTNSSHCCIIFVFYLDNQMMHNMNVPLLPSIEYNCIPTIKLYPRLRIEINTQKYFVCCFTD